MIEAWGTQTNLWHCYTSERPPLWIVPAWPIARLSIDRISRAFDLWLHRLFARFHGAGIGASALARSMNFNNRYWITVAGCMPFMLPFVAPTLDKPCTVFAILPCVLLIVSPTDYRRTVLVFAAGVTLGYFLEIWRTTRECWTYYTLQTPPRFAVLARGMAAVAFWRTGLLLNLVRRRVMPRLIPERISDQLFVVAAP